MQIATTRQETADATAIKTSSSVRSIRSAREDLGLVQLQQQYRCMSAWSRVRSHEAKRHMWFSFVGIVSSSCTRKPWHLHSVPLRLKISTSSTKVTSKISDVCTYCSPDCGISTETSGCRRESDFADLEPLHRPPPMVTISQLQKRTRSQDCMHVVHQTAAAAQKPDDAKT